MGRQLYECDVCHDMHPGAWSAAVCCDPAAFGDEDLPCPVPNT